jgi:CubicO group peptidase (beta-lactamase class C family)
MAGPAPVPPERDEPVPRTERWARGLAALCAYPFVGQPDGIARYSDIGLMLLGEAVARLDGSGDLKTAIRQHVIDTFPRFFQRHLTFNPIRDHLIVHAQIAPTENDPAWRRRRVWGEVHDENACGLGGVAGHAGLFGAAYTVAALGQTWLDGAAQFGISAEVAREALTPQAESDGQRRGLGFALKAHEDSSAGDRMSARTFGHTGFTGTSLWVDPDARLVVAVLTNSVYYGRASQAYADTHPFRRAVHDAIAAACGL